jgi:hypothetical protein
MKLAVFVDLAEDSTHPPSIVFVPVDASTIRAYILSALGYAMIGS